MTLATTTGEWFMVFALCTPFVIFGFALLSELLSDWDQT